MFDHISIGVRDVARTKRFYDAALKPLGYACLSEGEDSLGYGAGDVGLWISASDKPVPADEGLRPALLLRRADARERRCVPRRRARGGRHSNGKPGLRDSYGPNYYAAFVVDPDGYRIEAYCKKPAVTLLG